MPKKALKPGALKPLGTIVMRTYSMFGQFDTGFESGAVKVARRGRTVPDVEGVACLGLEHTVCVSGGDDGGLGPDLIELARADVEAGKTGEFALVEVDSL